MLPAWPTCPECARPRKTRCPFCQVAADRFPIGDGIAEADPIEVADELNCEVDEETLLLCPTCDEPFNPQFYRHCEGCGFDFGQGLETAATVQREELTQRAMLVFAGIGLFSVLTLAYFAWILAE